MIAFLLFHRVFDVLRAPYCDLPVSKRYGGQTCDLVAFGVLDPFLLRLKVSVIAGAIFSSPVWLYQLWAFITPGLHRHERRWAVLFVGTGVAFFSLGAFFAYITLSKGLQFLLGFAGGGIVSLLEVTRYLNYVILMLVVFGVSFEFPLVVVMLNVAGVVSNERLRRWRRPAIFLLFVFAAVITPSQDPFTMSAMAIPLCLFYEGAIIFARLNDRRRARRASESPYAGLADDETSPLRLAEADVT